jgi:peptide deformylase
MSKILVYPNKILRQKAVDVSKIDDQFLKDVEKLKNILAKGENAAGLAAPQLGISKNFFGIKLSDKKVNIFINPKIKKVWGERVYPKLVGENDKEEDFLEGCLSFPEFFGTVKRYLKIEVEWVEIKGKKLVSKTKELTAFEAIVWQHESDHLEGILFVDYIKNEGGKFYKWNGKEMIKWDVDKVI